MVIRQIILFIKMVIPCQVLIEYKFSFMGNINYIIFKQKFIDTRYFLYFYNTNVLILNLHGNF